MTVYKPLMRKRIKELRAGFGYSLQVAADKIGISKPQLWELETGSSENPTLDTLIGMSKTYRTTISFVSGEK